MLLRLLTSLQTIQYLCPTAAQSSQRMAKCLSHSSFQGAQLISGRTHISLPPGIEAIGTNALPTNNVLESISIPLGVHTLEEGALSGNLVLRQVSLPQTLRWVKDSAFQDCMRLERIVFPEGVEWIERAFDTSDPMAYELSDGFGYSFSFIEITLPSTLCIIAEDAFIDDSGNFGHLPSQVLLIVPSDYTYAKKYAVRHNIPYRIASEPYVYNPRSEVYTMLKAVRPDKLPRSERDRVYLDGTMLRLHAQEDGSFYAYRKTAWFPNGIIRDMVPGPTAISKNTPHLCMVLDEAPVYRATVIEDNKNSTYVEKGTIANISRTIGPWYELQSSRGGTYYINANSVQLLAQDRNEREATIITESISERAPLYALPQDGAEIIQECFAGTLVYIQYDNGEWACIREAAGNAPRRYIRSHHLREVSEIKAF